MLLSQKIRIGQFGTGVGGRAYTQYLVEIFIDPLQKDLNRTLPAELLGTLAHEIHHVARTATIGFGETLLEACVSDGLADHFQDEITGSGPRPWDIALDDESLVKMRNLAEKEFYTEYDRKEWFFGSGPRDIPRWTGYSLGFHIVGEYLKKHPDQTAAKLYATPAQEFIN